MKELLHEEIEIQRQSKAFNNKWQNLSEGKTVDDIFIGNTTAYKYCGAEILPSFSCYDVVKAPEVKSDIERLKLHLITVC